MQKYDRTIDQMIQAARSCKQNIVEGSAASITSKETEIKLVSVAKASLHELLQDYHDYLRTREYRLWEDDSIEFSKMRELGWHHNDTIFFMNLIKTRPPETIANMTIILIMQEDYLLHRQLQRLADNFVKEGGMQEKMYKYRNDYKNLKK